MRVPTELPPSSPRTEAPSRLRSVLAGAREAWVAIEPGSRAWTGAAWGLFVAVCLCVALRILDVGHGWVSLVNVLLSVARALAGGAGIVVAVQLVVALPARYRVALASCLFVLSWEIFAAAQTERVFGTLFVIVSSTVVGAAVGVFFKWRTTRTSRLRMLLAVAGFASSIGATALGLRWLLGAGNDNALAIDASAATRPPVAELDLPDPGAAGEHRVKLLRYGSGTDRRRAEYGAGVDLRTRPVDGRPFLHAWSGFDGWLRTRYFGFDTSALPLNGHLWVPEGPGPFPVVVIVHGNHRLDEASEAGYDYLGEHLASHGYLFASVDENFLNEIPSGDNAARGWLLLEHLRAFRAWNEEAGGLLHDKIDLSRIALAGHSRGGEAITAAALFNKLPYFPDDGTIRFDYGFGVRALVALATTDRQYLSGGAAISLQDVDFLALQGSNDGDVEHFEGMQQYDRVKLTGAEPHLKAAVYIHRANHGQWNRVWGDHDKSHGTRRLYFNRKPLLSGDAQERVARAYVTAFLAVSLRGDRRYVPFLKDHRTGKRWLPDTIYLNRFEDSSRRFVSRFEEDVDLTTTTLPGGRLRGEHLTTWREQTSGSIESRAVQLGWDAATGETARYDVELPESARAMVDAAGALIFDLADANEPPNPRGLHVPGRAPARPPRDGVRKPIDLTIELVDAAGNLARLPLSRARLLQAQLESSVWKARLGAPPRREIVFQTFELPLAWFVKAAPTFDPGRLVTLRFVFDRTPAGLVVLDDVGFAPAPPP